MLTVSGPFEHQPKKIDLSWIFGLKFLNHFTIDPIVMSSYFQKVSRIKLRMRKNGNVVRSILYHIDYMANVKTCLWEHVSSVEFLVCPFSVHRSWSSSMFDFLKCRNNHFGVYWGCSDNLWQINDTVRTKISDMSVT